MATITTLNPNDTGSTSRGVINANFTNLNTDKVETSVLDTDGTFAANSDSKVATQKATKTYVDAAVASTFQGTRVYQNTTAAINTEAVLLFQVEDFDTNSFHSTVTNTSRITIPTGGTGYYHIGATLLLNNDFNSLLRLRLNGATYIARNAGDAVTNQQGCSVATIYYLAAGDYVEVTAIGSNAAATTSGNSQTNFWVYKIN